METCDPAHPTPIRTFVQPCTPKMSTPITPSGAPTRYRSKLSFASPVNQTTWNGVGTISPLTHTVWGHRAPPMLNVGRKSSTPGGISDRPGSESVNWNDHGPTGRLCIPSCTLITQIWPARTRRGTSSRTTCTHKASKRIRRRVRGKPEKPGPARIHKRGPEHAGQSCGRAVQRRT